MFDKPKFASILKNIYNTYENQREFAEKAKTSRSYISGFINEAVVEPPSPKVLRKIADNSKGITTYEELMFVCGHVQIDSIEDVWSELINKYINNKERYFEYKKTLEDNEIEILNITKDLGNLERMIDMNENSELAINKKNEITKRLSLVKKKRENIEKELNEAENEEMDLYLKLINLIKLMPNYNMPKEIEDKVDAFFDIYKNNSQFVNRFIEIFIGKNNNKVISLRKVNNDIVQKIGGFEIDQDIYPIPVVGRVRAGTPTIIMEEEIIGQENIPMSWKEQGEYFGLKVEGDSMEPKISEGDTVIIKRQNDIESNQTGVVLVNGEDATVKKIKKSENGITLIATNPKYDPIYFSNEEIEKLPVEVIGKVVELRAKF